MPVIHPARAIVPVRDEKSVEFRNVGNTLGLGKAAQALDVLTRFQVDDFHGVIAESCCASAVMDMPIAVEIANNAFISGKD